MSHLSNYSVFDPLMEGCQLIGFDYRYLYVNDAVARHGRKTKDELLGHTMMEVFPGIENTHVFFWIRRCLNERIPADFEEKFILPDGSTHWYTLKIEPVPEGVFILSVDISQLKLTEIELQNQLHRIEALREIDIAIISTTNLTYALKTIIELIRKSLSVDAADIFLLNPHSHILEFAVGSGFQTRGVEKTYFHLGQGYVGRAALEQRTIFISSLADTPKPFLQDSLIARENFISLCATPLIAKGRLVGALEIFHRTALQPDEKWLRFVDALAQQASIAIDSAYLFQELQRSNINLMLAYDMTLEGWSKALDLRDKETEGHTLRVTELTIALARKAGMPESEIVHVRRGALLHDIGKMGISDTIMLKPDKLSENESVVMRKHPVYAYEMLYPIEFLRPALAIPYCHHEKWDGTGYPRGLKGEQIPLPARLFAVVDVWDALVSDRPYRKALNKEEVFAHLETLAGTHLDPNAVQLFFEMMKENKRE